MKHYKVQICRSVYALLSIQLIYSFIEIVLDYLKFCQLLMTHLIMNLFNIKNNSGWHYNWP